MNISVCIATYQRPQPLRALLADLAQQKLTPREVVVVDNDEAGSARTVIEQARASNTPFPLVYEIQPQKNVAITRNRTVMLARHEWLAFIDDDERAPCDWLEQLAATAARYNADGVQGPVLPVLPDTAPAWLRRGRFYQWARMNTGVTVPPNQLRFGNVLLRASLLQSAPHMFDPAYGLTGGEDGDLLTRLVQAGASIVWCDQGAVHEPVADARLSLRWLLLRALRGGQDFARHALAGRYGTVTITRRVQLFSRAFAQMFAAGGLALVCLPLGRHWAAHWLEKAVANLGKLSAFAGMHYREYA